MYGLAGLCYREERVIGETEGGLEFEWVSGVDGAQLALWVTLTKADVVGAHELSSTVMSVPSPSGQPGPVKVSMLNFAVAVASMAARLRRVLFFMVGGLRSGRGDEQGRS